MKITNDFFIISQSTVIDGQTGSLSLFNIIEDITVDNIPSSINGLRATARFTVENNLEIEKAEITLKLIDPNNKPIAIKTPKENYALPLKPDHAIQKSGVIIDVSMNITEPGKHTIKIYYDNKEIASQSIQINAR